MRNKNIDLQNYRHYIQENLAQVSVSILAKNTWIKSSAAVKYFNSSKGFVSPHPTTHDKHRYVIREPHDKGPTSKSYYQTEE